MILDPPAVRAFDISIDAVFADRWNPPLVRFDSSRNVLRRLIVVEMFLNECAQIRMFHDLHGLILALVSGDICFVVGFLGVVCILYFVVRYLVPDSRRVAIKGFSDVGV